MTSSLRNTQVNVVIPALNEGRSIVQIIHGLRRMGCKDILVVDGHSRDGTAELARSSGAKVIVQNGNGKGGALREAFKEVLLEGNVVVMMDADGSMSPEEIPRFAEAVNRGADVAKGSRFLPNGGSEDMTPMRRVGNTILTGVLNSLLLTNYTDLCYGYIAFKRDALRKLSPYLKSERFEIETEICVKSKILGLNVVEIPSIEQARLYGTSKLSTLRDGLSIFKLILKEALRAS